MTQHKYTSYATKLQFCTILAIAIAQRFLTTFVCNAKKIYLCMYVCIYIHAHIQNNLMSEYIFSEARTLVLHYQISNTCLLSFLGRVLYLLYIYLSARTEILIAQGTQDGPCCNSTSVISLYSMNVRSALVSSYEEVRMHFNCTHWNVMTLL